MNMQVTEKPKLKTLNTKPIIAATASIYDVPVPCPKQLKNMRFC